MLVVCVSCLCISVVFSFFFSSRRRHTRCALVTGVQTCALPIYPNNPTGTMTSREEIARLHAGLRPDILFVLDQAYAEYLDGQEDDGGLELAKNASNVFVTRTFSKIYGLAAERIGWGYARDRKSTSLDSSN